MGSNTEKKLWTKLQNLYNNWSKGIKSDNFVNAKKGNSEGDFIKNWFEMSVLKFLVYKNKSDSELVGMTVQLISIN